MEKNSQIKFLFVIIVFILAMASKSNNAPNLPENKIKIAEVKTNQQTFINKPKLIASLSPVAIKDNEEINKILEGIQSQEILPIRATPIILEPIIRAEIAFAKDLDTDFDFYNLGADIQWPIASITKLMSTIIVIEEVGLDKTITISESAVATEGVAGNLQAGEQYAVGELIKAMILVSSNDAAAAIVEFYGAQNFVNKMRVKAFNLDMKQTSFSDPTGISPLNQSTIGDLEKLIKYIDKNYPFIFKLSSQGSVKIFEETKKTEKELLNINNFAGAKSDFIGGKTGFIDESSGNLISLFNHNNHKILIIVLGTDDRFGQTEILYNWIKRAYIFN